MVDSVRGTDRIIVLRQAGRVLTLPAGKSYKIYNGWWFVGRPTSEEIRMDLRALMSRRPDWVYSDKQSV